MPRQVTPREFYSPFQILTKIATNPDKSEGAEWGVRGLEGGVGSAESQQIMMIELTLEN
jgi:hypothetical protein